MSLLTPVGVLLPDSSVLKTHRKTLLIYVIFSLSLPFPLSLPISLKVLVLDRLWIRSSKNWTSRSNRWKSNNRGWIWIWLVLSDFPYECYYWIWDRDYLLDRSLRQLHRSSRLRREQQSQFGVHRAEHKSRRFSFAWRLPLLGGQK